MECYGLSIENYFNPDQNLSVEDFIKNFKILCGINDVRIFSMILKNDNPIIYFDVDVNDRYFSTFRNLQACKKDHFPNHITDLDLKHVTSLDENETRISTFFR